MKKEARKTLINGAKIYKENLLNKNILIITKINSKVNSLEVKFPKSAYLHLTGVQVNKDLISAKDFFNLCAKRKIRLEDFDFKSNGTTKLKLDVLESALKIPSSIKMVTAHNGMRPELYTDRLVGNVRACLGLINKGNYYVPNTLLKTDIRQESTCIERVIVIMEKHENDKTYKNVSYLAEGIEFEKLDLPKEIKVKIGQEELEYAI